MDPRHLLAYIILALLILSVALVFWVYVYNAPYRKQRRAWHRRRRAAEREK